jgi:hypothetical protein
MIKIRDGHKVLVPTSKGRKKCILVVFSPKRTHGARKACWDDIHSDVEAQQISEANEIQQKLWRRPAKTQSHHDAQFGMS